MRTGKLSEPVRKRSVLRQLNSDRAHAEKMYGTDCVTLGQLDGENLIWAAPDAVPGAQERPGRMVTAAVNALLAAGAVPQVLTVQAVLPADYEESALQRDMKEIAMQAKSYDAAVVPGQIEVSSAVTRPVYIINGMGQGFETSGFYPGQELVLTRWIALSGTAALAECYEDELQSRYPVTLVDRAKEFSELFSSAGDARAITHFGSCAMHALGQGGIFGALWEMAEHAGIGLEVDLKKIPVKQETIEICEYFDINPYELYSAGSLLVGTDRAEALVSYLRGQKIPAAVIGRATDGRDRVIKNGEDCRFLDRPKQDEWYRRFWQS